MNFRAFCLDFTYLSLKWMSVQPHNTYFMLIKKWKKETSEITIEWNNLDNRGFVFIAS